MMVTGLVSLPSNCQLKFGKVHQVNRIIVISGLRVLLNCLLEIVWKSSGNLFGWICSHPELSFPDILLVMQVF